MMYFHSCTYQEGKIDKWEIGAALQSPSRRHVLSRKSKPSSAISRLVWVKAHLNLSIL